MEFNDIRMGAHVGARRAFSLSAICIGIAGLSACGGGGGGGSDAAGTAGAANTVRVTAQVIDGPRGSAQVCVDMNDNAQCDVGEPAAPVDADGSATLTLPAEDASRYPLLAVVTPPATAQRADDPPDMTVPADPPAPAASKSFVMSAPAGAAAVISPLSTLVKLTADMYETSASVAETSLAGGIGMLQALLGDYAKSTDAQVAQRSTDLAQAVVLMQQEAMALLAGASGSDGVPLSDQDLMLSAQVFVQQHLGELAAVVGSDAVAAVVDGSARKVALDAAVAAYAGSHLDAASLRAWAASLKDVASQIGNEVVEAKSAPSAGATLRWFAYASPGDWGYQRFQTTVSDDTPDVDGVSHYTETRRRKLAGTVQTWGDTSAWDRTDVFWTGSQWFACPTSFRHPTQATATAGTMESRYCGVFDALNRRAGKDVSGMALADLVKQIRSFPLVDSAGDFAQWGPDPSDPALAGRALPSGSRLLHFTGVELATPKSYRSDSVVRGYGAALAGGDEAACASVVRTRQPLATLEAVVQANPGTPCRFAAASTDATRNEWWDNSTLSIGTVAADTSADATATAARSLRIGFGADGKVTYYRCQIAAADGSSRNCDAIGTSTYSIETLGDARVMSFAAPPAAAATLDYTRIVVERGGVVHLGSITKPRLTHQLRPNQAAMTALFEALGVAY